MQALLQNFNAIPPADRAQTNRVADQLRVLSLVVGSIALAIFTFFPSFFTFFLSAPLAYGAYEVFTLSGTCKRVINDGIFQLSLAHLHEQGNDEEVINILTEGAPVGRLFVRSVVERHWSQQRASSI